MSHVIDGSVIQTHDIRITNTARGAASVVHAHKQADKNARGAQGGLSDNGGLQIAYWACNACVDSAVDLYIEASTPRENEVEILVHVPARVNP